MDDTCVSCADFGRPGGSRAGVQVLNGVDVSSFQGPPGDWVGLAGAFDFAVVKISEVDPPSHAGGPLQFFPNPDAAADWAYLKAHGKARIAYMFARPSVSPASSAGYFISQLTPLGIEDTDGIALDLEVTDNLRPAAVSNWAQAVLAELRSTFGRVPLLYTFLDFAQEGNCAGLGGYPLWISETSRPAGDPIVPAPWHTWMIHQYSTGAGKLDHDVANVATVAQLQAALGKIPPPPPPVRKEIEMILVQVDQATVPAGIAWPGVFLLASNGSLLHVTPPEAAVNNVASYQAAGIPGPVNISYNEFLARGGTGTSAPPKAAS
jgi:GH25 family lysozyme M1 (1,4-beta-N-acetylmuramidase)